MLLDMIQTKVQNKNAYLCITEAFTKQDDLSDEVGVGHHHGDGSEHGLEIVRQLRPTSVA